MSDVKCSMEGILESQQIEENFVERSTCTSGFKVLQLQLNDYSYHQIFTMYERSLLSPHSPNSSSELFFNKHRQLPTADRIFVPTL
jgi:hypothetical protein